VEGIVILDVELDAPVVGHRHRQAAIPLLNRPGKQA
jgi:hypothetical protein